jgi:hypothetical protein
MTPPHSASKPAAFSLFEWIGRGARNFFDFAFKAMEAYDALPLEPKYRIKKYFQMVLVQGGHRETADILLRDETELAKVLANQGWWVLERDITGPIQRDILRLAQKDGPGEIDTYFCKLFSENNYALLDTKVQSWLANNYMAERKEIVLDCLWAHKQQRYTLTIPSLLSLFDGLTRGSVRRSKQGNNLQGKRAGSIRVKQFADTYRRKEPSLWSSGFRRVINEFVFESFKFDSQVPRTSLNRHGILHGEIAHFGTESNSLKLFLMIDTVQNFIQACERDSLARRSLAPGSKQK